MDASTDTPRDEITTFQVNGTLTIELTEDEILGDLLYPVVVQGSR